MYERRIFPIIVCILVISMLSACNQNNTPVPPTVTLPSPTVSHPPPTVTFSLPTAIPSATATLTSSPSPTPELIRSLPINCGAAGAQAPSGLPVVDVFTPAIVLERGRLIVVSTTSDEINGNTNSVAELLNTPGSDGISLREALFAVRSDPGQTTILFDPQLKGATIKVGSWDQNQFPHLDQGGVIINGDINGDSQPDITIENDVATPTPGMQVFGFKIESSNNTIHALRMVGFSTSVVLDAPSSHQVYENNTISHLIIEADGMGSIGLYSGKGGDDQVYDNTDNTWLNTWFIGNRIRALGGIGISLARSSGDRVEHLVIFGNTIQYTAPVDTVSAGIGLAAGFWLNKQGNTIRDVLIAGNDIEGNTEYAFYLDSGAVGSSDNLVEDVRFTGNHIKLTQSRRPNGAPYIALLLTTADGATDYGHPQQTPVVYPDRNVLRNIWVEGNVIEGFGGQGISITTGTHGSQNNIIEQIYVLGNLLHGFYSGAGSAIAGISLWHGTNGGNQIRQVFIQHNTIQLANQRASFGGEELVSGGILVALGAGSENDITQDIWLVGNDISNPASGISLVGGWANPGEGIATNNTLAKVYIWCNIIHDNPTLLQTVFPFVKGISMVGGYEASFGNVIKKIEVAQNMVAGVQDDVSVLENIGAGSQDNHIDFKP
jgi:hypothetical protein